MDEGDILFFRIQIHLIRRKIMTIYDELVARGLIAVSYTHLTLPTILLV